MQTLVIAIPAVNRAVIDADAVASWNWTLSTPLDGKLELSTPLDGQLTSSPPLLLLLKVVSSTRRLLSRAESCCCLSAAQRPRLLKTAAAASKSPPPPSCCGDSCPAEQSRAQDRLLAHLVVDLLLPAFQACRRLSHLCPGPPLTLCRKCHNKCEGYRSITRNEQLSAPPL